MITRLLFLSGLLISLNVSAQQISAVYKTGDLLKRISAQDTIYVINFWATWCKPCVQELPAFDSLAFFQKKTNIKILLVSLDFVEDIDKKVNPFLRRHKVQSECVLLDETNGHEFINRISDSWSGAIPATIFKTENSLILAEKKLNLRELQEELSQLK